MFNRRTTSSASSTLHLPPSPDSHVTDTMALCFHDSYADHTS